LGRSEKSVLSGAKYCGDRKRRRSSTRKPKLMRRLMVDESEMTRYVRPPAVGWAGGYSEGEAAM
jgi:hypothetical protein